MEGDAALMTLYQALQDASSQNPAVMKSGEAKLQSWETQPGFYPTLAKVLSSYQFNMNARFVAVVTLKQGVDRQWRKALNSLPEEEKVMIRTALEQMILVEPQLSIVTQLCVVMAKIARLDVPRDWTTLLPFLMQNIRHDDPEKQLRALMACYHVIKVLSTKRLTGDRKIFQEMASEMFDYLSNLWDTLFVVWASSGASGDCLHRAHFALKIMRILCVRGYKMPHESRSIQNFVPTVMRRAKETLEIRASRQDGSALLEKHVINMWKIIGDLLEIHPLSFVPFLASALDFASYFGFSEDGRGMMFEKVAIHPLNLMKAIILCPEFRPPKVYEVDPAGRRLGRTESGSEVDPLTFEAASIKEKFFGEDTLNVLVRVLVTRYLPLTPGELDHWNEDPEEFALRMEESGETWKYNLRQSAETLLVTFFKEYKKSAEVLLSLMKEFEAPLANPSDHQAVLAKDALYNAAGITAFELYDELSFDQWLSTTLVHELTLPVPILHRRITWLVGQWTGVKISPESRPTVYSLLLSGLRSSDVVVRLSSSQALKNCLDDFDFVPEVFEPYLQDTFHNLFSLLQDVRECDNKMRVLHTMSFLIERVGCQIKTSEQIASLASYLPMLWANDHNMLKAAVVSTSIQLVNAVGPDAIGLREFLFPVIKIATDLNCPEHIYLLEDALDLWHALMEDAPEPVDNCFVPLVDNLIPLLGISTENLKMSLTLVNCYSLIYPESFVQRFGTTVCQELNSSVADLRADGTALVMRCIETMLRTSPVSGPIAIKPIIGRIFRSAHDAMDTPILMSLYLSIASRLLLISEPVFQYGLECVGAEEGKSTAEVLTRLVEVMCTKVINIVQPERKKLISIALLKLMSTGDQMILHQICGIFLALSETLNDVIKPDRINGKCIDSLCVVDFETTREDELVTENDLRKKRLAARDVVYTLDLAQLFKNEISNLRVRMGDNAFSEALSAVDSETMQAVKPFLE